MPISKENQTKICKALLSKTMKEGEEKMQKSRLKAGKLIAECFDKKDLERCSKAKDGDYPVISETKNFSVEGVYSGVAIFENLTVPYSVYSTFFERMYTINVNKIPKVSTKLMDKLIDICREQDSISKEYGEIRRQTEVTIASVKSIAHLKKVWKETAPILEELFPLAECTALVCIDSVTSELNKKLMLP